MRTLIIPCAGQSSRFTTKTPKWLLKHPSGNLMVYESIIGLPLNTFDKIVLVALKRHLTDEIIDKIHTQFESIPQFKLLQLSEDTESASQTVYQCISKLDVSGSIFIKDADDYFFISEIEPNEICTYSLNDCKNITPGNKSYIKKNDNNEVLTIVEKSVISADFCCGLYTFDSAQEFVETYESIDQENEIYISHVIFKMILNGKQFKNREAAQFIDWGTQEDWDIFNKGYSKNKYKK
tara:strand:+ start:6959 stop:7669 length:711 start_codon:yes stop_codon:yes gene_type:complete